MNRTLYSPKRIYAHHKVFYTFFDLEFFHYLFSTFKTCMSVFTLFTICTHGPKFSLSLAF